MMSNFKCELGGESSNIPVMIKSIFLSTDISFPMGSSPGKYFLAVDWEMMAVFALERAVAGLPLTKLS